MRQNQFARLLAFIVLLSVSGLVAGADAEQKEVDALYKSVIAMMKQISELEARVAMLESSSSQALSAPTSMAPNTISPSDMKQIGELEARVARLESSSSQTSPSPISIAPNTIAPSKAWWVPSNWSKLRVGMSEGRVKQILGSPTGRDVTSYGYVTLKYSGTNAQGIYLTGNVGFNDEDQIPYKRYIKPPAFE